MEGRRLMKPDYNMTVLMNEGSVLKFLYGEWECNSYDFIDDNLVIRIPMEIRNNIRIVEYRIPLKKLKSALEDIQ